MNHKHLGTGRHLMTGSMSIFMAQVFFLLTGLITAVFLARKFGPEKYGLYALAINLINWIEWITTALFTHTTIKFISEATNWRSVGTAILKLQLFVSSGIAVLVWFLASSIAGLFNEPIMETYLKLFAIDIPIFSLACVYMNTLVGLGYYKEQALVTSGRCIGRLILIVLLVEMGLSVEGAILGIIGASVIGLLISMLYIRISLFSKSSFLLRRIWSYASPLFMSAFSQRIFRIDLIALKFLGGTASMVGFYSAAQNISLFPNMYANSISSPLLSTLSRLLKDGDKPKAEEIALTSIRSMYWLLPFAAVIAVTAPEIISFIYGQKYLPAAPILSYLIFAVLALGMLNISKALLTAAGKPGWTFILTGPMVPLSLLGYLLMIPRLGGVGAAIVVTLVAVLGALASMFAIYQTWGILPPLKTIFRSVLISGCVIFITTLWPVYGLMIILKIIALAIFIVLIFLLFGEFSAKEIALIRSIIRFPTASKQNEGGS